MPTAKKQRESSEQFLLRCWLLSYRKRFDGHPGQWADKKLFIPYSTQEPTFLLNRSPWLIPGFEALGNKQYSIIDIRGPAGSGKSLLGEIDIAFCIQNDPGLYYYIWPNDDDAKDQIEDRVMPLINGNDFLCDMMPLDRHKKRNTKIVFPDMSFYAVGANESNAQRVRAYRLTMEEPHMFKPGMVTKMQKRMRGVTGSRQLSLSTGSVAGDQSDEQFKTGSCHEFLVPCPHCEVYQAMSMQNLEWDKTADTIDVDGNYRWDQLRESVRYQCESCNKPWPKDQKSRLEIARKGKIDKRNPNSPSHHFSYHYNALVVDWIPLEDIAQEYILARHAMRIGNVDPYKDFVQKTEANAWDETPPVNQDAIRQRFGGYVKRSEWPDEVSRFMTVDNQYGKSSRGEMPHRWCLVRAWGLSETRLIESVRVDEWEDVESLRRELHVDAARVLVDIAFDRPDVLKQCYAYGWQGLIGDDKRQSYPHKGVDEKRQPCIYQMPYSPPKHGHVGVGQPGRVTAATYYHWCHKPIKDLYHRLANAHAEDYEFSIADDCGDDYQNQVQVEYKRLRLGKWEWYTPPNKDNHLLDSEQMNLAAAVMDPKLPLGKSLRKISMSTEALTPA